METTCRQLEECMNQDPGSIGRAKVAAETFAQVVNSFVEEISWKTLVRCHVRSFMLRCRTYCLSGLLSRRSH